MTQNNISIRLNFDSIGRSVSMDFPQNQKWKKCRSVFFNVCTKIMLSLHDANSAEKKNTIIVEC